MISFSDELLARMRMQLENLPAAARKDVLDNDVGLIERQLQRYQRRLRNYLLDARFQLKYTGYLVATAILLSVALGSLLWKWMVPL